jgi:hypothetical protein
MSTTGKKQTLSIRTDIAWIDGVNRIHTMGDA